MSENVIQTIREYFATQPIEKAWLFGSYARGEERADSDVDILVTLDKEAKVGLLQYVHIMNELKKSSSVPKPSTWRQNSREIIPRFHVDA